MSVLIHRHREAGRAPLPLRAIVGLVLALGLGIGFTARAATLPRGVASHSINAWLVGQGLPHDRVTAVVQTADEYLWVGTEGGLARFDGLRFTTYRTTNTAALTNHSVRTLLVDRTGTLWIGTDAGLVRHRDGRFEPAGLAGRVVHAMCEDAEGALWVATDQGVLRQRGADFEALPAGVGASEPKVLFADRDGRVWIGFHGQRGVVCARPGQWEILDLEGALLDEVLSIAQTPDGALWFGSADGLVQWHEGRVRRFDAEDGLAGRRVSCLHVDAAGVLWVASEGLQRIAGGEIATIAAVSRMRARTINSLCHDREGNVWAGTADEGLLRVRQPAWQLISLDARGVGTGFRTVMQGPDGTVWLAQGSKGVVRVGADGEVTRLPPRSSDEADEVLGVFAVAGGEVFVGTRGALQIWRGDACETFPEFPEARVFFTSRDGTLWIGLRNQGVLTWKNGKLTPVALPPAAAGCTPSSFSETAAGEILVGTWAHGLVRLDRGRATGWNQRSGAPADNLRLVYVDRDDAIWIGAPGLGLAVLHQGQLRFADWTSELIDQRIDSLSEDDAGNLWISCGRGVFMAPREELLAAMLGQLDPHRLRLVYVTEGYRGAVEDLVCFPNVARTRTGQLWYATRHGILIGDATKIAPNLRPPAVHIERVIAGGRRWEAGERLTLPAGTSGLLIEYSGLSLSAPQRVRFRYRIEGIDTDWVDAGERRAASYASLPPGRHRFQVIACNADGVWNDEGALLEFEQKAYLHQRPWFSGLAGGLVVATAFGLSRWRVATLRREKRRLELAIAARTRELRVAKDLAEASTRAKSEFIESISHEIRNPLNGVIGLVELLRDAPLDPRQDEILASLRACARALGRVFAEVLSFTRLEHGREALRETSFSLRELVEDTVALYRATEPGRGGEFLVEHEPGQPDRFIGDDDKIQTILGNFISNALRHAPGSRIEIRVSADSINEFGASVTFVVADHGEGIPPEEQEVIFGKFVRGSRARRQRVAGTGLGLATSRVLAERMGGHVGVESEPGTGASFFLTLRLKRDRSPCSTSAAPGRDHRHRQRALVVEDQPYNQIVMQRIAERLGFDADVACDAREALRLVDEQAYAVVLLDWELPDLSGEEIARRIRARSDAKDTILVATTAHADEDIRRRGLAAGFDGFALKPLDVPTIERLLDEIRRRRCSRDHTLDTRVFRLVGRNRAAGAWQAAEQYTRILDEEVGTLSASLQRDDRTAAARTAHRLKTHAGLVQAIELRDVADRLERGAHRLPRATLLELRSEMMTAAVAVKQQLSRSSPPAVAG